MDTGYRELLAAVTGNLKQYKKLLAKLKNAAICPIAARVLQLVEKHYGGNL
ncbi:MAG: hypothetical protein ACOC7X_10380 [Spirochaetota bacterium]